VLFLTHTGQIGGAEMCLLALAPQFGGDVLAFQPGPLGERLAGLGVRMIKPDRPLDLSAVKRDQGLLRVFRSLGGVARLMRQIIREARLHDLVYCNSQKGFVLGAMARPLHRVPLLWHLHDILDRRHFGAGQIRLVVALANRMAAGVVAPSQAVAAAFIRAGGRPGLVRIVANGVASDPVLPERPRAAEDDRRSGSDPQRDDPVAARQVLGLPAGPLVGVFSRLAPWKGQHVLLEALSRLPGVGCLVVGGALFGEEHYGRSLERLAEHLGIQDRIRFLGHRNDVATLMRAVDVVVHPSVAAEPFGLTLVEAMHAGTPLVASSGGAADEILDGGTLGVLVPPDDAGRLAEAIAWCFDNPSLATSRAQRARRQARRRYDLAGYRSAIAALVVRHARGRAKQSA